MVTSLLNPLSIFIIALGTAFLLSLFHRMGKVVAALVFLAALAAMASVAGYGLFQQINGQSVVDIYTAGFAPPFSINLRFGLFEAFASFAVNLMGVMGGIFLLDRLKENPRSLILYIVAVMGVNGLIMTRDLFNLFVFIEITSIASYSLIAMELELDALTAGFKYMMAGGVASSFLLLGIIFLYSETGTLNIDSMTALSGSIQGVIGLISLIFLFAALIIEMKPFPANGWGLDVYQAAPGGIAAFISVGVSTGSLFALYKVLPLYSSYLPLVAILAGITFFFSNLMGLNQDNVKRLLGYSSIAQMGLVLLALVLLIQFHQEDKIPLVVGGLFLNHFLAKAGLFWITDTLGIASIKEWKGLGKKPLLFLLFGVLVMSLVGLPPFPGFWSKWELVMILGAEKAWLWIVLVLLGSLIEAVYMLRWFGQSFRESDSAIKPSLAKIFPVTLFALLLLLSGWFMSGKMGITLWAMMPVYGAIALYILDFLPGRLKTVITMGGVGWFAWSIYPELSGINLWFALIFLGGTLVVIFAGLYRGGGRKGYYPMLTMMTLSLGTMLLAETTLAFFFAWELMTLSSYLLVRMGKKSHEGALLYIVFSLGGAFLILGGFALSYGETLSLALSSLHTRGDMAPYIALLMVVGFLVKSGALGLHLWVRDTYSESDDDFSAIISPVVSKAGIFGLFLVGIHLGTQHLGIISIPEAVSWLGVITAFAASIMAAMEEDMKKLLAYSSMGQVGYIIASVATMSHLGWVGALYQSANHFLFKALLFLAIAGVIHRTGTRYMYQLGGLIKKMPVTYISVLVGILAMSGVPPLAGFGGKWIFYSALFEQKMYFQLVVAISASGIAFLYLWRLIHTIFLGQLKHVNREVKEAPVWLLIPQVVLIAAMVLFSTFPKWIIAPFSDAVAAYIPSTIGWSDNLMTSSLGYWNGYAVMIATVIMFIIPLVILLLSRLGQRSQRIEQLNIVFASERPDSPERSHVAYNIYAHYQKAMGDLIIPRAAAFWHGVSEWTHTSGSIMAGIYTGNGQTYAFHVVVYIIVLYFFMGV